MTTAVPSGAEPFIGSMAVIITALAAALGNRDWRQLNGLPAALEQLWGRAVLYLPPLQMLGWYQAVTRNFDPDNLPFDPRDLTN